LLDCSREQRLQATSVVVEPVLKPLSIQLKRLSADEFCSAKRHSASTDKANISDDSMEHDGEVCDKVSARQDRPQSGTHDKAPPETAAAVTGRVDADVWLKSKKSKCKTKQLNSGPETADNGVLNSEKLCDKVSTRQDHPQSGPHDKAPPETATVVAGRVDAGVRLKSKKSKCKTKQLSSGPETADSGVLNSEKLCDKVSARQDHPQSGPHDKAPAAAAVKGRVDADVWLKSKKSKCKTKQLSSGPATAVNGVLSSEDQSSLLVKSLPSLKSTISPSTNMASGVLKTTVKQDGEEQITSVMPVGCTMAPSTHAAADFNGSSIANISSLQTEPDEMFVFMDEGPRGSDDTGHVEVQNQKSRGVAGRRRPFPHRGTSRGGSNSLTTNSALDTAGNCAVSERGCGRGRQGGSRSRRFGSRRGRGAGRGSTYSVHHDVLEATGRDSAMNWSTNLYAVPGCDMLLDSFAGDIGSL